MAKGKFPSAALSLSLSLSLSSGLRHHAFPARHRDGMYVLLCVCVCVHAHSVHACVQTLAHVLVRTDDMCFRESFN